MANLRRRIRPDERFYPLDNGAVFIASVTRRRDPYVYRLSCELDEPIYLPDMEAAFEAVIGRFPAFLTELRPGFFWYYLEPLRAEVRLMADSLFPAEYHSLRRWGRYLFRVRVYSRRVSCEFHHCLTDGSGAIVFLKALVAEYLARRGVVCEDWGDVVRAGSEVDPAEYEDVYADIARRDVPAEGPRPLSFNLPGRRYRGMAYRITTGTASVGEALGVAKARGATLTELLAACHLYALQAAAEEAGARRRPIRVQVPVNLRRFYPSPTLRNFFLCVSVDIDPRLGRYDFDEILERVRGQMRLRLTTKEMSRQVHRNVRAESMLALRVVPLPIKNLMLRAVARLASSRYSGSISNLGPVRMPEAFARRIERFEVCPSRNSTTGANVTVISWEDRLAITVGSLIEDRGFEREFFRALVSAGVATTVDSNV
jgi:hypothetical protein